MKKVSSFIVLLYVMFIGISGVSASKTCEYKVKVISNLSYIEYKIDYNDDGTITKYINKYNGKDSGLSKTTDTVHNNVVLFNKGGNSTINGLNDNINENTLREYIANDVCPILEISTKVISEDKTTGMQIYGYALNPVSSNKKGENTWSSSAINDSNSANLNKINGSNQSSVSNQNSSNNQNGDIEELHFCEESGVLLTFQIIGYILFIAKILIPLILIILASMDFAKAVINSSDKANVDAIKKIIQRFIIALIIFLIPTVLDLLIGFIDGASETMQNNEVTKCTDCLLDPLGDCKVKKLGE